MKKTLMFTGVCFWLGLALLAGAVFGLVVYGTPVVPPGNSTLDITMSLYSHAVYYGSFVLGVLGVIYTAVGWQKAKRWTMEG